MIEVRHRGRVACIKLPAILDEDNDLADVPRRVNARVCIVDFGEVTRINSCGVRDWVRCIDAIKAAGVAAVFVRCPPAVVQQMNSVYNFSGHAEVKSFFAPFFCADCDREQLLLCEASEVAEAGEPPMCRCESCDGAMDFDDLPDAYFEFLDRRPVFAGDREVLEVLDELVADEDSPLRRRVDSIVASGRRPDVIPTRPGDRETRATEPPLRAHGDATGPTVLAAPPKPSAVVRPRPPTGSPKPLPQTPVRPPTVASAAATPLTPEPPPNVHLRAKPSASSSAEIVLWIAVAASLVAIGLIGALWFGE